jgi:hypothetical protein
MFASLQPSCASGLRVCFNVAMADQAAQRPQRPQRPKQEQSSGTRIVCACRLNADALQSRYRTHNAFTAEEDAWFLAYSHQAAVRHRLESCIWSAYQRKTTNAMSRQPGEAKASKRSFTGGRIRLWSEVVFGGLFKCHVAVFRSLPLHFGPRLGSGPVYNRLNNPDPCLDHSSLHRTKVTGRLVNQGKLCQCSRQLL